MTRTFLKNKLDLLCWNLILNLSASFLETFAYRSGGSTEKNHLKYEQKETAVCKQNAIIIFVLFTNYSQNLGNTEEKPMGTIHRKM